MKTRFIEASQDPDGSSNHGKFLVATFDENDWTYQSQMPGNAGSLLRRCGWGPEHFLAIDAQTGEGGFFRQGGYAHADLDKHQVWVCPMFEPFLAWLYKQDLRDLAALPGMVVLPDAEFSFHGYRRPGRSPAEILLAVTDETFTAAAALLSERQRRELRHKLAALAGALVAMDSG